MTVNDMSWFCVEVDLKRPVQARREAQDGPGVSGCVCPERSEFSIPPAHSSIAGNPQGGHVGYPFFWYLFFG